MVEVFLLLLFCVSPINARSQGPSPSLGEKSKPQQQQTKANQQKTASDQRGTEQTPFVVKTVNPPKTEAEANQERKDRAKKASYDWWFLVFTALVACFALLQLGALIWQAYFLKGSLEITREAADTAKGSTNAAKATTANLIIAERAHIFAIIEPDKKIDLDKIDLGDKDVFEFNALLYLHNLGKTPAIIKEIAFTGIKSKEPPSIESLSKPHYPIVSFIGSNDKVREDQFWFYINKSDLSTLRTTEPKVTFYCFGYVKYKTIFDEERCHGFCLELDPPSGQFALLSAESELNYDK